MIVLGHRQIQLLRTTLGDDRDHSPDPLRGGSAVPRNHFCTVPGDTYDVAFQEMAGLGVAEFSHSDTMKVPAQGIPTKDGKEERTYRYNLWRATGDGKIAVELATSKPQET
jgi:hypothetical protein